MTVLFIQSLSVPCHLDQLTLKHIPHQPIFRRLSVYVLPLV
jgi:hypothetical protein